MKTFLSVDVEDWFQVDNLNRLSQEIPGMEMYQELKEMLILF